MADAKLRRQHYKKNRREGLCMEEAAVSAGYPQPIARHHAEKYSKRRSMVEWFRHHGVSDEVYVRKCREGMEATKVILVHDRANPQAPPRKVEIPDWKTRYQFLETSLKLSGKIPYK